MKYFVVISRQDNTLVERQSRAEQANKLAVYWSNF